MGVPPPGPSPGSTTGNVCNGLYYLKVKKTTMSSGNSFHWYLALHSFCCSNNQKITLADLLLDSLRFQSLVFSRCYPIISWHWTGHVIQNCKGLIDFQCNQQCFIIFQFIYPLPREQGYEFMYAEFKDHKCYFTSLLHYQVGIRTLK